MKKMLMTAIGAAAFGLAAWAEGTDVLMWYLNLEDSPDAGTASSTTFDSINFYMVDSSDKSRTPVVNLNARTYENAGDLRDRNVQNAGISAGDGVYIGNNHGARKFVRAFANGCKYRCGFERNSSKRVSYRDQLRERWRRKHTAPSRSYAGRTVAPMATGIKAKD